MSDTKPHGILKNTNSGVEIPGTLKTGYFDPDYFSFTIDGAHFKDETRQYNLFGRGAGWIFEPDLKELPTEPGLYQDTSNGGGIENAVTYRLTRHGWANALNNYTANLDMLRRVHTEGHLIRLIREEV